MSALSEWFHEQEQEEREAKRRANLDEWRRIARMLRDLEYIKVPVKGECFQRIRQRHPHRADGGKAMTELQPCPICKGTRICMDGGDNTYHPRCLDCGCTAPFDAWQSRTPAPVEVERLVDDLLSVSKQLGQSEARGLYDHIEPAEVAINDLKSRLLAAFANTTPNLSGDVKGWLPIETAPKDGTRVKLLTQGGKEDIGYWSNYPRYNPDDLPGEWSTEFGNCDTPITHWMPVPEPPDRKAGE